VGRGQIARLQIAPLKKRANLAVDQEPSLVVMDQVPPGLEHGWSLCSLIMDFIVDAQGSKDYMLHPITNYNPQRECSEERED
jgi:hypothetical protein